MKARKLSIIAVLTALGVAASGQASSAPATPAKAADELAKKVIVVLEDDVASPKDVADLHARTYGAKVSHIYTSALKGYAATVPDAALEGLRASPHVAGVTPDGEVRAYAQYVPTGVNRINAEYKSNTGSGVQVAVLDTGIESGHPDLAWSVVGGVDCTGTGSFLDDNGHGTHVAGIIGARNNSIGVVGVAPAAYLHSVKVLDATGTGSRSEIICGLDYVDARSPARGGAVKVANMSLGGGGSDNGNCGVEDPWWGSPYVADAEHYAVCNVVRHGVTVVAAAGNMGVDLSGSVPAAYNEVIAVTALADSDGRPGCLGPSLSDKWPNGTSYVNTDDTFWLESNFASGSDIGHTVGAPGKSIWSTLRGGSYGYNTGTSMASPHVAGVAALFMARWPQAKPSDILSFMKYYGERNSTSNYCPGDGHWDRSGRHNEEVARADKL